MIAPPGPYPKRPLVLGRAIDVSTVLLVISAIVFFVITPKPWANVLASPGVAIASLAYGGVALAWPWGSRRGVAAYFTIQTMFVMALFHWTHGIVYLLMFPVISQSTLAMPRWGSLVLVTLLLATLGGVVWMVAPSIRLVAYNVIAIGCASALVLAFSELAVRERMGRIEIEQLNRTLQQANTQLADHAAQAEQLAALAERNRLAREIHDGLGHYLTVIHVQLEAAKAVFDRDRPRALDAVAKASRLTQEGLQDIRQSVAALRSPPALRRSLTEAMTRLAEESRSAGLEVDFEVAGKLEQAPAGVELALFRAAQEGLTNARRHAHATRARVSLVYENRVVMLTVADKGRGASSERAGGFGLVGLQERMQLLGGEMRIETSPGAGFTLVVRLPLP